MPRENPDWQLSEVWAYAGDQSFLPIYPYPLVRA